LALDCLFSYCLSFRILILQLLCHFFDGLSRQAFIDAERVDLFLAAAPIDHFLPREGTNAERVAPNVNILAQAVAEKRLQELVSEIVANRQQWRYVVPLDRLDQAVVCLPGRLVRMRILHLVG